MHYRTCSEIALEYQSLVFFRYTDTKILYFKLRPLLAVFYRNHYFPAVGCVPYRISHQPFNYLGKNFLRN